MNTTEKLNAIADKCRANLALAAKRTPGNWIAEDNWVGKDHSAIATTCHYAHDADAAYIAACAGAAEAGWRTTLAAIAELYDMSEEGAYVLGANIIAAWEGLL